MCKCGAIGIDEGRILGCLEDIEPRSMYVATVRGKRFWLPQWVIETSFKQGLKEQSSKSTKN